jgi:4-amino-4-deoxy-L-arabinose transferase-like glycosyltransferase
MHKARAELNQSKTRWLIAVLIAVTILGILVLACVPPVSRDALIHHLAVPKLYLEQGGIHEIPDCVFSYYPMNLDLLYMIPLSLGNDILPKYIHFTFALLTALLLFFYIKKEINTLYGLLGVLLFISTPVIIKLSITVYVDLGLIFFSTAALLAFIEWKKSGFRLWYLILAAVFCGLALGTKYNGLITFFLLTLFIPFAYSVEKQNSGSYRSKAVKYGIVFAFVAILVFLPWLVRNYIWTDNPVYPLFNGIFETGKTASVPDLHTGSGEKPAIPLDHFSLRKHVYDESLLDIALIPVRVFFQGQDDNPKYFDGILNPYLFCLPLAWLCLAGKKTFNKRSPEFYLFAFSVLYLLFVFFRIDMRIRWIAPIIPPLVILSVYGFNEIIKALNNQLKGTGLKFGKAVAVVVLGIMLALNIRYMADLFDKVAPLEYITGSVSRADYISRFRPAYKLHEYTGRNLPEDSKILGLFLGNRRYYSRREIVFKDSLLKELISRYNSDKAVGDELNARGITHLMIRQDMFEKWVFDNFNQTELSILKTFFNNHLKLMYADTGYVLYKLI